MISQFISVDLEICRLISLGLGIDAVVVTLLSVLYSLLSPRINAESHLSLQPGRPSINLLCKTNASLLSIQLLLSSRAVRIS